MSADSESKNECDRLCKRVLDLKDELNGITAQCEAQHRVIGTFRRSIEGWERDLARALGLKTEDLLMGVLIQKARLAREHAEKQVAEQAKTIDRLQHTAERMLAQQVVDKQLEVTQAQLDKFMSACADQTIQIMELRGELLASEEARVKLREQRRHGVPLSTARDVLKNLDSMILKANYLLADGNVSERNHTWSKLRMLASEARDWLGQAICNAEHPAPPVSSADTAAEMSTNARPAVNLESVTTGNVAQGEIDSLKKQLEQQKAIAEFWIAKMQKRVAGAKAREQERVDVEVANFRAVVESQKTEIAELRARINLLVNPNAERDRDDRDD